MNSPQRFLDRFDYLRDEYLASRKSKSGKIVRILRRELWNPADAVIADIGCSEGHITESLSKEFGLVVGLDIDYPSAWAGEFPFIQADGSACRWLLKSSMASSSIISWNTPHLRLDS